MTDKELIALMAALIVARQHVGDEDFERELAALEAISMARRLLAKAEHAADTIMQQRGY